MYKTHSASPKKFGNHTSAFKTKPSFGGGTKRIYSNTSRPTFKSGGFKSGGNRRPSSNKRSRGERIDFTTWSSISATLKTTTFESRPRSIAVYSFCSSTKTRFRFKSRSMAPKFLRRSRFVCVHNGVTPIYELVENDT